MTDAGFIDGTGALAKKKFARAVSDAPAASRTFSHTYVNRWLNGMTPRDEETHLAIAEALGSRLGRVVALDELGFRSMAATSPDVGLSYPDAPDQGVATIAQLLGADLANEASIEKAPANAGAWSDASMAWLVGAQKPLTHSDGPSRIGLSDVERLRAMRTVFDGLDSSYGGDHARDALIQYLRGELPKLLRADARGDVRRALFVAGAEMTQLAAWMSYDSGRHGLAQRYFIQALGLADAGGDKTLAAGILDAMSHQATFLGRHREAANMARAARLGTQSLDVPILTSHFFAMEARALARTGDVADCDRAMAGAVEQFERVVDGEGPAWIGYFDASELAAELAHCNRDLGRPDLAITHASECLGAAPEDAIRSNFFVAMVLADAHVDRGDVEEGCRVATEALAAGDALRSARCRGYVDEFKQRLTRHHGLPVVQEFTSQTREHHLWAPPTHR